MVSEPTIFLIACIVSLGLTALIREVAPRIGLTDNPDGHRKLHGRATPLGGGVAVYLTTAIILGTLWIVPSNLDASGRDSLAVSLADSLAGKASKVSDKTNTSDTKQKQGAETPDSDNNKVSDKSVHAKSEKTTPEKYHRRSATDVQTKLKRDCPVLPGMLLAGLVIVIVGLVDDTRGLPGKVKLLGQTLAASILIISGLLIENIALFGHHFSLGLFSYPLTLLWLLGAINALNLLDGIDGLATMLGIIFSFTIAAMAVVTVNYGVVVIAMVFASSLLGFLRFNFPPATIFLGDTGSMLIGLMVGAMAILGSFKGPGTVLLAAPLAVWTIPFFDVIAAIIRRKLTGRSIYSTDRGHMHHRLLYTLGSNRKVLGWLAFCCTIIAIAILVGIVIKDDRIMLITCFAIVVVFIATGAFGRAELLLVGTRVSRVGRKLTSLIFPRHARAWQVSIRLQGSQQWNLLWDAFVESADKLCLCSIRLDVNLPTLHESFHATWERPKQPRSDKCWHVEVPLVCNSNPVGRVYIVGERNGHSACQDIQQLMELIEPFESRLRSLALQDDFKVPSSNEECRTKPDVAGIHATTDQHPK
ncbi:MAG: undecaprenyl/decaprenyl-phosphate alpha-N-acetylglucosaminyl 1-phosphate transferase [Pirellulales bacterium]|nr:undecaprenyl/decaprenyl-phosphate alpha-N-acetylglucosaminyl 1-phosphate transferase [Pirellulales bacterium]